MGKITKDQLRQIAEIKMPDLNAHDVEAAMNILAGTARSMGVTVVGLSRSPRDECPGATNARAARAGRWEGRVARLTTRRYRR